MLRVVPDAEARIAGWVLAAVPLGWIAGTALQLGQAALSAPSVYAFAVGAACMLALVAWRARRVPALAALLCCIAALAIAWGSTGLRAGAVQERALDDALEGVDLVITGVIASLPQQDDSGSRFNFAPESALHDGSPVVVPPLVRLAWYRSSAWGGEGARAADAAPPLVLRPGDRWRFVARLRAPHGNVNPHGFDYELWLWERGLQATGYVRAEPRHPSPELLGRATDYRIERLRQVVRDRILALAGTAPDGISRRAAGVVAALATGDQNAITRADWDVFRVTGVAHLVSISGLHISMMAWLAALVVGTLWRRAARWQPWLRVNPCAWISAPNAALGGGLLLAGAYAAFSGLGVPAQRTLIMLAGVVLLRLAGLRWPWWIVWLWACCAVLVVQPWAFLQAGFWLSFVAVGVLFITDERALADGARGARARARLLLRTQARVTLALAPLTLVLFGQASVVGLLANLVAIPWVTLVVTPLALAGLAWSGFWTLAAWAGAPLLVGLQALAALPGAQFTAAAAPLAFGVAAALGALLLVLRWPWSWRTAGLPLILPLLLWQAPRPTPGEVEALAIDIGQGNAVLVRTAHHALLYDSGPRYSDTADAGDRVIVPLLRALGERPDRLVLSHGDTDHTGGAASVAAAFPEALVLASLRPDDDLPGLGRPPPCHAGLRWVWDGVVFEVLHPYPDAGEPVRSSNSMSCVLRVVARSGPLLLAGDIEARDERALVARGAPLRSDALLVPHHGSKTSSSPEFLDAVQARVALVQAGWRNRYNHPAAAVVARHEHAGSTVFDSAHCGAMRWRSVQPDQVTCERLEHARYWFHRPP